MRTAPCAMSALLDARHRHIAKVVAQQFGLSVAAVEEVLAEERALATAADFFAAEGTPSKLIFFRQSRDIFSEDGELIESAGARMHAPAHSAALPATLSLSRGPTCCHPAVHPPPLPHATAARSPDRAQSPRCRSSS